MEAAGTRILKDIASKGMRRSLIRDKRRTTISQQISRNWLRQIGFESFSGHHDIAVDRPTGLQSPLRFSSRRQNNGNS